MRSARRRVIIRHDRGGHSQRRRKLTFPDKRRMLRSGLPLALLTYQRVLFHREGLGRTRWSKEIWAAQ